MPITTHPSFQPTTRAHQAARDAEKRAQLAKRLKPYVLRDQIGDGGYGSVFLTETYIKGKTSFLAMKVVPWKRIAAGASRRIILGEVESLKALADTGSLFFPQIRESFGDFHNLYIVTDYLPGGSLRDELERAPMKLDRIRFVAAQLVVGLSQMRDALIIHRDLKPDNIMLDVLGNVTIIDFGLCRKFDAPAQQQDAAAEFKYNSDDELVTDTTCGTLAYSAPEVLKKNGYSFPVDVWSFGVILFEMLFNKRPFYGKNLAKMIAYLEWRVPNSMDADPVVLDLLKKVLHKNPGGRSTIEELKAHAFFDGVDWDVVASRSYALPEEYAPMAVKPNKYGHIDHSELLDPKVSPMLTSPWLNDLKTDFVKAFRIKKSSTKSLVARPSKPRCLSSKIKKALARFSFSRTPVCKPWPVSANAYVKPASLEPIATEAGSAHDLPGPASPPVAPVPLVRECIAKPAGSCAFSEFNCSITSVHAFATSTHQQSPHHVFPTSTHIPDHPRSPRHVVPSVSLKAAMGAGLNALGIILPPSPSSQASLIPPSLATSTFTSPSSAGPITPTRTYLQAPFIDSDIGSISIFKDAGVPQELCIKSITPDRHADALATPRPVRA